MRLTRGPIYFHFDFVKQFVQIITLIIYYCFLLLRIFTFLCVRHDRPKTCLLRGGKKEMKEEKKKKESALGGKKDMKLKKRKEGGGKRKMPE